MGFFDDITKKLTMVGQEAANQTKNFAEKTRLNAKLSDEEKQINSIFQIIGKNYYEANKDNPNADYIDQILSVKDAYVRIDALREQLKAVAGVRTCPNCGAEVAMGSMFCNTCGSQMPAEAPVSQVAPGGNVCPQCGNAVAYGAAFCNLCGSKMPEMPRQPLGGAMTPNNGAFSTPGFGAPMNGMPNTPPVVPAAPAAPIIPDMVCDRSSGVVSTTPAQNYKSDPTEIVIPDLTIPTQSETPQVQLPKKTVSIEKKD